MALMSQLTQSIYLCFGLPLLLLPGGTISVVYQPTISWSRLFPCPTHLSLFFLHLSVIFCSFSYHFSRGLLVFGLSRYLLLCPFQFLHLGASHRHCLHDDHNITGWTILLWIFALTCGGMLLSHGTPTYSSSCFIHTVSSRSLICSCLHRYAECCSWHFVPLFSMDTHPLFQFHLQHGFLPCTQHHIVREHHMPKCFISSVNRLWWQTGKGWKQILGGGRLPLRRVTLLLQLNSLQFRTDSTWSSPIRCTSLVSPRTSYTNTVLSLGLRRMLFSRSKNIIRSLYLSCSCLSTQIAPVVDLPFMNPNCSSLMTTMFLSRFSCTLSYSFMLWHISLMPR